MASVGQHQQYEIEEKYWIIKYHLKNDRKINQDPLCAHPQYIKLI